MIRNLREFWKFRGLVGALIMKHLRARYRGSLLGFFWSFLNPLCLITVYALVFKFYIRFQDVEHYTLFMFAGLLPWIWFSSGVLEATSSISSGGSLITKALFPAHILPAVSVLTNLANFLFALPLVFLFMLYYGIYPGMSLLILPLVILLELVFLWGLGLGLAAINVHFRDVQHILANFLTLWFFLCPIVYPAKNIPEKFQFTLYLNPMALITELYQYALIGQGEPTALKIGIVSGSALCSFVLGNYVFNRYRESFAELI